MKRFTKNVHTRVGALLLAATLALSAAGCASREGKPSEETGTSTDTLAGTDINGNTGMGRYVEKNVLALETWGSIDFQRTESGELIMFDDLAGKFISKDNGESWELEKLEWFTQLREKNYVLDSAMSADGTIVLAYFSVGEITEKDEGTGFYDGTFDTQYLLAAPDGTLLAFDMGLPEEIGIGDFCFSRTGRLFASTSDGKIYEINTTDGSHKEIVKLESGARYLNECQNHILICVASQEVYLYDLGTNTFIEDAVLQDFIKDNYTNLRDYGNGYNAYLFGGEENIVYLAGEKGLYRHVIGGSFVEQVIDGGLTSFGDPSHFVKTAAFLEGGEFLALFSDGKIMKFVYDATISSVPNNRLAVYSLEDNDTIRQAITAYQTANPDMYVSYEIGMEGEGVTRDDALKKLSTALMNGSGPDILVLDKMPYDSYMDKGILMDISGVIDELDKTDGLFRNLLTPLYREDSLYMIPAEFQIPLIAGHQGAVENANDYKGIADALEAVRAEKPESDLIFKSSETGIMKTFFMVCEPSWIQENGKLEEKNLREFLIQTKRIYDAQMNGTPQEAIENYQSIDERYIKAFGCTYEESIYFNEMDDFGYLTGSRELLCGTIGDIDDFSSTFSVSRIEGFEDTQVKRMDGQSRNVYCPVTMVGINGAAENPEKAALFLQTLLGEEVQKMTHYGFPVNQKAFESGLQPSSAAAEVPDDGMYMTYGGTDDDGNTFVWSLYWPDDKQAQQLRDWIAQSDTPYLRNVVIEGAVCREGAKYLNGSQDIETTVKAILDNVAIYMAE